MLSLVEHEKCFITPMLGLNHTRHRMVYRFSCIKSEMVFLDGQMTKSEAMGTYERVVLRCLKHVKAKGYLYIRTDSVQE